MSGIKSACDGFALSSAAQRDESADANTATSRERDSRERVFASRDGVRARVLLHTRAPATLAASATIDERLI